jgi:hypothetical protein
MKFNLYNKLIAITPHVLVYHVMKSKVFTKLHESNYAHNMCMLSQQIYRTFLWKAVVSIHLSRTLDQILQDHEFLL